MLHRYSQYIDDVRRPEFLELFAADAVFSVIGERRVGREAIAQESVGDPGTTRKHLPFPAVIELTSPREARAWSDFILVRTADASDPSAWQIYHMGRDYDRLVKEADGRWRFAERAVQVLNIQGSDVFPMLPGR